VAARAGAAVFVTASADMAVASDIAMVAAMNGRVRPVTLPGVLIQCLADESRLMTASRMTGSTMP
jgi:hypothetical protein